MRPFRTEQATHKEDLPHAYTRETAGAKEGGPCDICDFGPKDPLHVSWEKQQLWDRERASAELRRELGS